MARRKRKKEREIDVPFEEIGNIEELVLDGHIGGCVLYSYADHKILTRTMPHLPIRWLGY